MQLEDSIHSEKRYGSEPMIMGPTGYITYHTIQNNQPQRVLECLSKGKAEALAQGQHSEMMRCHLEKYNVCIKDLNMVLCLH